MHTPRHPPQLDDCGWYREGSSPSLLVEGRQGPAPQGLVDLSMGSGMGSHQWVLSRWTGDRAGGIW